MSNISVGLDIGNFSVKVAQVKQRRLPKEGYLTFGIREIKPEKSHEVIVTAIKEACNDAKIESNKVILSVYGPEIIMRYITLPCLEINELSRCLEFELERYIPGKKRENMVIDYKILYKLLNNQMVVFLIALERKMIEERIGLVKDAGLVASSINVDSLALMNAYNACQLYSTDKEVTAILDIGHTASKLVVFQGDTLYFSRDINNGIYDLIRLACERTNMDFNMVNELGPNLADKPKDLYMAIKTNLNGLVDELRLSFEYCWRHLQKKVSQLYLSGGGSKLKMIEEVLSANLSLKTGSLDVTRRFKTPNVKREDLLEHSSLLTVAIGLAVG
jgi:type IV pilus assembly protein PilM